MLQKKPIKKKKNLFTPHVHKWQTSGAFLDTDRTSFTHSSFCCGILFTGEKTGKCLFQAMLCRVHWSTIPRRLVKNRIGNRTWFCHFHPNSQNIGEWWRQGGRRAVQCSVDETRWETLPCSHRSNALFLYNWSSVYSEIYCTQKNWISSSTGSKNGDNWFP